MNRKFVVGTEAGELAMDLYEETTEVFTDLDAARRLAGSKNEFGWIPTEGGLVRANAWKVYELVEVTEIIGR